MGERANTTERVFRVLRMRIVSGEIAPGTQTSIYKLADELRVSRTPVRDAVLRLADAHLVTIERNRGVTIRGVSVQDIREIFELRMLLEVPAAARAARVGVDPIVAQLTSELESMQRAAGVGDIERFHRHDMLLHGHIIATMKNEHLARTLVGVREETQWLGASTMDRSRSLDAVSAEHVTIANAIAAQDPVAAGDAMWSHLANTGTLLLRQIAEVSGEEIPRDWPDAFRAVITDVPPQSSV